MLHLKIERGPLSTHQNIEILNEYNRLTNSRIPMDEFLNWVQKSPAGTAWHATLTTDQGRLVGHTSIFPFTTLYNPRPLTPAKSEYSFVHEDFRTMRVRGFENSAWPPFMILLGELLKVAESEGWAPVFASTCEKNHAFTERLGLLATEFKVRECLFVLRPLNASRHTPNLSSSQRAGLLCAGISHKCLWAAARRAVHGSGRVRAVGLDNGVAEPEQSRIAFFEDELSLRWRYVDEQYVRYSAGDPAAEYVIVKRGSADRYLRVCQWRLRSGDSLRSYLIELLREAHRENALGVRWALYDNDEVSRAILKKARAMGFVAVNRDRVVMVHKKNAEFLQPNVWKMNDSLFSFDP